MISRTVYAAAFAALLAVPAFADGGPIPEPVPEPEPAYEPEPEPVAEPQPAPAPEGGYYVGLGGGAVWVDDYDQVFDGFGIIESDTGWAAAGTLGSRFGNGARTELEVGYRDNDGAWESDTDASISALSLMVNGLYDFNMNGSVVPYLGVGAGAAQVTVDFTDSGLDADSWAFAYQFIGGLTVPLPNTQMELFADYRYLATAGLEVDFDFANGTDEYRSHTVLGGVRLNF